jgi:hypothetical protein
VNNSFFLVIVFCSHNRDKSLPSPAVESLSTPSLAAMAPLKTPRDVFFPAFALDVGESTRISGVLRQESAAPRLLSGPPLVADEATTATRLVLTDEVIRIARPGPRAKSLFTADA